jgi:hypothetical protein
MAANSYVEETPDELFINAVRDIGAYPSILTSSVKAAAISLAAGLDGCRFSLRRF